MANSIESLFDDSRLTKEVMAEAQELFSKSGRAASMDDAEINHRLFQIFCQTEEMMKYVATARQPSSILSVPFLRISVPAVFRNTGTPLISAS